jgi:hypothetical protein
MSGNNTPIADVLSAAAMAARSPFGQATRIWTALTIRPLGEQLGVVAVRCGLKIDEERADREHHGQAYDNRRPDPCSDRVWIKRHQTSAPVAVTTAEKT